MHGTLGMLNRKGRKRKSGRRTKSGDLVLVHPNYQTMAAEQPHRRWLPEAHRLSEKAGTVLGGLNLIGRISNDQYEAGRRFSVIVGAYRSVIGAPRGTSDGGKGYACVGSAACPAETCICLARTNKYNRAYEALWDGGQLATKAVNRTAVHDEPCPEHNMDLLRWGLDALAKHFGLTGKGRN